MGSIRFWGALLAVVLLAEFGLHALDDRLPQPMDWFNGQSRFLVAEMDRTAEAGIRSDIVFVGSSMIGEGIDVQAVEDRLVSAEVAQNTAINSARAPVIQRWLTEEVVPRLEPQRVVWGVSSRDFNENRPEPSIDLYNSSRATRLGLAGTADRFLASVSLLSRYRSELRDNLGILEFVNGPNGRVERPTSKSMLSREHEDHDRKTPNELAKIQNKVLVDWELGEAEKAAFVETILLLEDLGIEVAIVIMPVPSEYVGAHPNGQADYEVFVREVESLGTEHDFEVLDFGRRYPDESFKDYSHLRSTGATTFSRDLAEALAGIGW